MATAVDSKEFSNISAPTAAFTLKGGYYFLACVATFGGGNVELQVLGPDVGTDRVKTVGRRYDCGISAARAIQVSDHDRNRCLLLRDRCSSFVRFSAAALFLIMRMALFE